MVVLIHLTKRLAALWIAALAIGLPPAHGQNIALRDVADQAVLVHSITKSACLMLGGAQFPVHADNVETSSAQLLRLSAEMALQAETSEAVLQDIETLARSAQQIAAGDHHTVPVTLLLKSNPRLASRFTALKTDAPVAVRDAYQGSYSLVQTLRVTSQAFQRDLCLFMIDLAPPGASVSLTVDIAFFERSLEQLMSGDLRAGLVAAPNIHIKVTLGKIVGKWKTLEPILAAAASGQPIDPRDVQLASVLGDAILKNLDEITDHFLSL